MSVVGKGIKSLASAVGDAVISVVHQRKCFCCRRPFVKRYEIRRLTKGDYDLGDQRRGLGRDAWVCYSCIPKGTRRI